MALNESLICWKSKQIVREWVDRGSLPTGKKFTSLPAFPPNVHMLHVLPGSTKANYAYFASYLEEKGVVRRFLAQIRNTC